MSTPPGKLNQTLLLLALALTAATPSHSAETKTEPLNQLLSRLITENGATNKFPSNPPGPNVTIWERSKDQGGEQVWLTGNQVSNVVTFLKPTFGDPVWNKTNAAGGVMIQYNQKQLGGIGLTCSSGKTKTNLWTHINILNAEGLRQLAGGLKSIDADAEEKELPGETRAKQIALRAAAARGIAGELDAIATYRPGIGSIVGIYLKSKGPIEGQVATAAVGEDGRIYSFELAEPAK